MSRIGRLFLISLVGALALSLVSLPGASAALVTSPDATWMTNGTVNAMVRVGNIVYIGGDFTSVRATNNGATTSRTRLAAFNATTGGLLGWAPSANAAVHSMALSADGSTIYAGGAFTSVNGMARRRLVALNTLTGTPLTTWAPSVNNVVRDIALAGNRLYAGGVFTDSGGTPRMRLAAFHSTTGALDAGWAPEARDSRVRALAASPDGSRIYVGGNFSSISGVTSTNRLAAVSATDGSVVMTWRGGSSREIFDIATEGGRVFTAAGGAGGELRGWSADNRASLWRHTANGDVQAVAVRAGTVYGGGHFYTEGACERCNGPAFAGENQHTYLAAVAASNGAVDFSFTPFLVGFPGVWVILPTADKLHVGGDFTWVGTRGQQGYTQFSDDAAVVNQPPTVSISAPEANATLTGNVTVSVNATDNEDAAGALAVAVSIDGGAWQPATWNASASRYQLSWNTASLSDGQHTITAQATDSAGNTVTTSPRTVTTSNGTAGGGDTTSYSFSGSGGSWQNHLFTVPVAGDLTATLDWDNASADLNLFLYDSAGTPLTFANKSDKPEIVRFAVEPGNYRLGVGYKTGTANYTLHVSIQHAGSPPPPPPPNTAPTASITAPVADASVSGTTTIAVSATDAEDPVGGLTVETRVQGGSWMPATYTPGTGRYERAWDTTGTSDGSATIEARATDSAGLTSTVSQVSVTVANQPADPPSTTTFSFSGSGSKESGSWRDHRFTVPVAGDLTATLNWDNAAADLNLFLYDSAGTPLAFANRSNKPEVVQLAVAPGNYRLGVSFKTGSAAYTLDVVIQHAAPANTEPTVALTAPAADATVSGTTTIAVNATDNEDPPGTLTVDIRIDDGDWLPAAYNTTSEQYERAWDTTTADNGARTITARATDSAGSTSTTAPRNVTVDNAPPPPPPDDSPQVTITSPAAGEIVSGTTTIAVNATDGEDAPGTLTVDVRIDDGSWRSTTFDAATNLYSHLWDTTEVADGSQTISARAVDSDSNTATAAAVAVTVSNAPPAPVNTAPTAAITAPTAAATVGDVVTIDVEAADAEDAIGTLAVEVRINDGDWLTAAHNPANGLYQHTWETAGVPDGSYTITARATDSGGLTTTTAPLAVEVVNTPPPPEGEPTITTLEFSGSGPQGAWRAHSFSVLQGGKLTATLDWDNTSADLNLFLYDSTGTLVAWRNKANKPEVLVYDLTPGDYSFGIGFKGAGASYSLTAVIEHPFVSATTFQSVIGDAPF
jgi:hypothetical protein